MNILAMFSFLDGWKTYLAASGLVGLSLYQVSTGEYGTAIHTILSVFTVIGVRHAIHRQATNKY